MRFIADLHIHSKYSRATSRDMVLEELDKWADDKGILVLGTGDFTHPLWFKEIKEKLEPAEPGLFRLKSQYKKNNIKNTKAETRFLLTVEISSIYSKNNRTYRVHNLVFAPDIKTAEAINTQLSWIGNLNSDGRPILGLDSEELAKIVFNINPEAVIIPAHAWTPWFSVFGSMSGFNSLEECFGKYTDKIFAIETGLSSDPKMNWRLSKLDNIALISNSDSHSPSRIGREANIFEGDSISYNSIINAIRDSRALLRNQEQNRETDPAQIPSELCGAGAKFTPLDMKLSNGASAKPRENLKFMGTIEFFPEEGKYHFDGHRLCNVVFSPKETNQNNGICPKCKRKLTVGVANRVEQLADREEGFILKGAPGYKSLVPLDEIVAEAVGQKTGTKKVDEEYKKLICAFGNEIKILMDIPLEDLEKAKVMPKIIEGIKRVREGNLHIQPGYDGEYGKVSIFKKEASKAEEIKIIPEEKNEEQATLF